MVERQQDEQSVETRMYEPLKDSYDSIQLRLDPTRTLQIIKNSLLRRTWDDVKQQWVNEFNLKPMMSKKGIQDIIIELEARMSIDKVLGYITDAEYNLILREVGEIILSFIFFKADEYEINEADMDRTYSIINHNVRIFLSRARGGRENEYLSKQFEYKTAEIRRGDATLSQQQPKQSMFSYFGGRR